MQTGRSGYDDNPALVGVTWAAEPAPATTGDSGVYHNTPMAGEPFRTVFMGQEINIPARDRNNLSALTLGSTFYFPHQGDNMFSPIFALYCVSGSPPIHPYGILGSRPVTTWR